MHRYEVAQGFQPEKVPLRGVSDEDVIGQAAELMGSQPAPVGAPARRRIGAARPRIGVRGPSEELRLHAQRRAEETAIAQGLPPKVMDLEILRNVCELLGIREPAQARQTTAKRSGSKRL